MFILGIAVLLMAGCKKTPMPPTLEGTWRLVKYNGSIIEKTLEGEIIKENNDSYEYPKKLTKEEENVVVQHQPYLKFHNNKLTYYHKYTFESIPEGVNVPESPFIISSGEDNYYTRDGKIVLEDPEDPEPEKREMLYVLTDNKLVIISGGISKSLSYDEEKGEDIETIIEETVSYELVKVPDTEISNIIDKNDYPDLEDLLSF